MHQYWPKAGTAMTQYRPEARTALFSIQAPVGLFDVRKGASFKSNNPVMFAHNRVNTLRELKQLIPSHLGPEGQALTADDRLEYRPSWISENSHVWMTFEVHKRVMEGKVIEFYVEVRYIGCSSSFCSFVPPTAVAPSMLLALEDVAMCVYNSGDDSDYEDESSYASTEEDEEVSNTPTVGGPRLILPTSLPIPNLADVPSYFQQLDIDERYVEDPTMESVAVEYNTDGGAEFMVGHRMRNRDTVLMAVKNYIIRRNAEYRVVESDRLKCHCRCKHHTAGCPWMIRVALRQNLGYWYAMFFVLMSALRATSCLWPRPAARLRPKPVA
ncbi:hypothetical protein PIB30_067448 [Stylosanthes scabra]|uniref:Transposase MuDR plant domain-containing protein n=1 Tax=Stylosanthes scabra TaxID=79078 RepID=A0ABU6YMY1_9FABA|nr:hypothetical protein [Stylosanthes scabra]